MLRTGEVKPPIPHIYSPRAQKLRYPLGHLLFIYLFIPCLLNAVGRTVRESSPGGGKIFRTRPDWPWGPSALLYNGYRVSSPGVKRTGSNVNNPLPSSAEVKERVELYL